MSLLLDALKKSGEKGTAPSSGPLALEPVTKANPQSPSQVEDQLMRMAGQNLFAAKADASRSRRRIGIIPVALITGLVFAAGGGYYVWREISPPQVVYAPRASPVPVAPSRPALLAEEAEESLPPLPEADAPAPDPVVPAPVRKAQRRTQPNPEPPIVVEQRQTASAVDPVLMAAYLAYRSGDFPAATQRYSEVLQRDAANRDALLGMAAIAQQQGQDASAMHYYTRVLTLDPRDPVAFAGFSSLSGSDAAGSESRLKLLLTHNPNEGALHFALGNLYTRQSRWGDAQQAYFNAYNREPDNAQFAYNLAVSLDHLGQAKLAAQYYRHALRLDGAGMTGFDPAQVRQRAEALTAP